MELYWACRGSILAHLCCQSERRSLCYEIRKSLQRNFSFWKSKINWYIYVKFCAFKEREELECLSFKERKRGILKKIMETYISIDNESGWEKKMEDNVESWDLFSQDILILTIDWYIKCFNYVKFLSYLNISLLIQFSGHTILYSLPMWKMP